MALDIKHSFVNPKSDGSDPTIVQPSDWNDPHSVTGTGTLRKRPTLHSGYASTKTKPTPVTIGTHLGYSLPVYNSDDEELFYTELVEGRWNGSSDITVSVICCLASAEDVGDKFQLRLSWNNKATGSGAVSTSETDVDVETTLVTDRNAQYSIYKVDFTLDWDVNDPDIIDSDTLGLRLRRIAASSLECSGEIIILDTIVTYTVNKLFKS